MKWGMPLFSNKFCPKKPTPRKVELSVLNKELGPEKALQDLGLEIGPIRLKLGDQESLFDNGEWLPETGPVSGTHKENHKLRQYVQQLEDENNLLKLKYEILLDMLTQTTAESHLQEKQMEQLQKQVLNSSRIPRTKRLGVRSAHISTEKSDELDKPVEYSKSKAYTWKAQKTRSGGHLDNYPSYQPYIVSGCLTVFLLYFCVFREENDIDEELGKTLYDRIEGLEERQLQIALKHNLENRQDTSAIVERLKELQKK